MPYSGAMTISIEEMRRILGPDADQKTDEQLERLRDGLIAIANETYDSLTQATAVDRESVEAAAVELPDFPAQSEEDLGVLLLTA